MLKFWNGDAASAELLTVVAAGVAMMDVGGEFARIGDSALALAKLKPIELGLAAAVDAETGADIDEVTTATCGVDSVAGWTEGALVESSENEKDEAVFVIGTADTAELFCTFVLSVAPNEFKSNLNGPVAVGALTIDGTC